MNRSMFLPGLFIAAFLAACDDSRVVGDEDSTFFSVPPGSTFTLNREITIQPHQTSVYLQNGEILLVRNVDFYRPHCKFELFTISEQARVVEPDTFVVTRIIDQREDVSTHWPLYASLSVMGGNGPMHITYSTTMYLESQQQPDVLRMNCKQWDWINTGEFLSINQMRQALGDYFTLTLAE